MKCDFILVHIRFTVVLNMRSNVLVMLKMRLVYVLVLLKMRLVYVLVMLKIYIL